MSTVRQYELIYIAPGEATEEALAEIHNQVAAVVERFEGVIEKTENWGRRRLAYEIGGQREGVGLHLNEIDHDGAAACRNHVSQFEKMLGAARGDAVGKFGKARFAHHVDVLDLDIARRQVCRFVIASQ